MVLPMLACQMRTVAMPSARRRRPGRCRSRTGRRRRQVAAVAAPVDEGLCRSRPGRTGSRRRGPARCRLDRITVLLVLEVAPPMPSICLPYGSGLPITRIRSGRARRRDPAGQVLRRKNTPLLVPPRMYSAGMRRMVMRAAAASEVELASELSVALGQVLARAFGGNRTRAKNVERLTPCAASSMFCSTSRMLTPPLAQHHMMLPISRTNSGASPAEGSSNSRNRGSDISARPMASICCAARHRR